MSLTHLVVIGVLAAASPAKADPFGQLRAAYAKRDADAAASAYAEEAVVSYRYRGLPEERYAGSAAIATSFRRLFDQIDAKAALDLNFRVTDRKPDQAAGFYRLRVGGQPSFGRFTVTFAPDGKFATDVSTEATLADFEEASGPVLLAADDEVLDRDYYVRLTGRYRLADGCQVVVTRSVARLFARNSCTGEWRGLTRVSGLQWTAGDRVLSDKSLTTYRFAPPGSATSASLRINDGARTFTAQRMHPYRTEEIGFTSPDGTRLAGTLYLPNGARTKRAATVLVHGSGPQDRDGYASIIGVLADEMASNGRVVLAYDKRGSGDSAGDGARAAFDQLADDATAGMALLRSRAEVDAASVGLAGSSQAGWIAARAIQRGATPSDVFLLGAAGAALTVAEQNLYNTEVQLRCAHVPDADIKLALDQQRAFFDFLADPAKAAELDRLTRTGRTRPALVDWLFPDSRTTDRRAGAWYVVLDPAFDPLPVWRSYRGKSLFLFAEHDDATPTRRAISRLAFTRITARILPASQHLGLNASDPCRAQLKDVSAFSPGLFQAISDFARHSAAGGMGRHQPPPKVVRL